MSSFVKRWEREDHEPYEKSPDSVFVTEFSQDL
jgi:hypothetical protein